MKNLLVKAPSLVLRTTLQPSPPPLPFLSSSPPLLARRFDRFLTPFLEVACPAIPSHLSFAWLFSPPSLPPFSPCGALGRRRGEIPPPPSCPPPSPFPLLPPPSPPLRWGPFLERIPAQTPLKDRSMAVPDALTAPCNGARWGHAPCRVPSSLPDTYYKQE